MEIIGEGSYTVIVLIKPLILRSLNRTFHAVSQNLLSVTDNGKTLEVFAEIRFKHSNIGIPCSVTRCENESQILLHLVCGCEDGLFNSFFFKYLLTLNGLT
jgi:hypothetical protein